MSNIKTDPVTGKRIKYVDANFNSKKKNNINTRKTPKNHQTVNLLTSETDESNATSDDVSYGTSNDTSDDSTINDSTINDNDSSPTTTKRSTRFSTFLEKKTGAPVERKSSPFT